MTGLCWQREKAQKPNDGHVRLSTPAPASSNTRATSNFFRVQAVCKGGERRPSRASTLQLYLMSSRTISSRLPRCLFSAFVYERKAVKRTRKTNKNKSTGKRQNDNKQRGSTSKQYEYAPEHLNSLETAKLSGV